MDHAQHIIATTQEIFSSMIMLEATPGEPFKCKVSMHKDSISGVIGMAGTLKGLLAIHLPNEAALAVTNAFLGMDHDEINDDVRDAIGELANMLGGSLKCALDPKGSNINLSLPSSIHGAEYSIDFISDADDITIPFELDGNTFLVELQLAPNR